MRVTLYKVAAILAWLIGGMAIFAGGRTLLGRDPGYHVINWLVLYNYTVGVLTFFGAAILIWSGHRSALPVAGATFGIHAVVMLVLQVAYRGVVAPDSIAAMTVRLIVWVTILALMLVQARRTLARVGPVTT